MHYSPCNSELNKNLLYRSIVSRSRVMLFEKWLEVSFWTFFKYLGNEGELERTETAKNLG